MIEKNCSLKAFNSFSIDANTHHLFHFQELSQLPELLTLIKQTKVEHQPILVLGGGSNTLFCDDFSGLVIKVELTGIHKTEDDKCNFLQVAAGENWHDLVCNTIDQGINRIQS